MKKTNSQGAYCFCCFVPDRRVDISKWDITLTSCILSEILPKERLSQPALQAIEILRELRNSTLHKGNVLMSDDEYIKTFNNVSNNIEEVSKTCGDDIFHQTICEEIHKLQRTRPCLRILKEAQEYWRELKKMNHSMAGIENTLNIVVSKQETEIKNIESYTKSCFKKSATYVEPKKAMDSSIKHLREKNCLTLTGDAGSGKTSFCKRLVSRMKIEYPNVPAIILIDSSELKKLNFENGYILFIDDILEKYNSDKTRFNTWSAYFDYLNDLIQVAKENIFVIFAARNGVWHSMKDKFLDYSLFKLDSSNAPVVDLSSEKYGMTYEEKINMLRLYCKQYGVDPKKEIIEDIAKMDTPPRFQLICKKIFSNISCLKKSVKYLFQVTACSDIKKDVNDLLVYDQNLHYAILVAVFLKYSSYDKSLWWTFEDIEGAIDIRLVESKDVKSAKIQSCLDGLLKTFIDFSESGYRFKHLVIYDAVLLSFRENYLKLFNELISNEVLYKYVRTEKYTAKEHEVVVRLPYEMLTLKLVELSRQTEKLYTNAHAHPSFHDKELVRYFLNMLISLYKSNTFIKSNQPVANKDKKDILNCGKNRMNFKNILAVILAFIENYIIHPSTQILAIKSNNLKKIFLTKFLIPFVTGACREKNDYLASETIKQFSNIYEFDFEVLKTVFEHDLIDTCKQFFNNNEFSKEFFGRYPNEKSGRNYITKASSKGDKKCLRYLQGLYNNEKL